MDNLWIIYGWSIFLVGGLNLPLWKYEFVNWDDDIPNIWENTTCSKAPTRFVLPIFWGISLISLIFGTKLYTVHDIYLYIYIYISSMWSPWHPPLPIQWLGPCCRGLTSAERRLKAHEVCCAMPIRSGSYPVNWKLFVAQFINLCLYRSFDHFTFHFLAQPETWKFVVEFCFSSCCVSFFGKTPTPNSASWFARLKRIL